MAHLGYLARSASSCFLLLPAPQMERTLVLRGQDTTAGVDTIAAVLESPFEVTAAAYAPAGTIGDDTMTLLRLEGLPGSVDYKTTELAVDDWETIEQDDSRAIWQQIRDITPFAGGTDPVWRVSVKPSDGPVISRELTNAGLEHSALFDWAGGLVWKSVRGDHEDAGAGLIRQHLADLGGHATLIRASASIRAAVDVFQPEPAPIARISAGLRANFDPRGILNPGRMR